ncbi:cupin [Limibacter armeniacum]|uniref:cupin domain-containing protein n=1 Tax=Limibacter armeniacum TaxID=466084 RepID=UPI002FE53C2D
MAKVIAKPTVIEAAGNKIKLIEEFVGRVNTGTPEISIAKMVSPEGWEEPGQTPEFDEYTLVLSGMLHIKTKEGNFDVRAGQAFVAPKYQWVQYSSPYEGGAEYIAVCLDAFSVETVHRDDHELKK